MDSSRTTSLLATAGIVGALLIGCGQPISTPAAAVEKYERRREAYLPPNVELLDQDGQRVHLPQLLDGSRGVALNFVFTTCTNICPVMATSFAGLKEALGSDGSDLVTISISLDPQYDSPQAMRKFADAYHAQAHWRFLSGREEDLKRVYIAFDAVSDTKFSHRPFTLLRPAGTQSWARIEGLVGTATLAKEYRALRAEVHGAASPSPPPQPSLPAAQAAPASNLSPAQLEEAGRRLFVDGILPSGQPIEGAVTQSMPFRGSQFACRNCHQRSGMGSWEGQVVIPMVTRGALSTAMAIGARKRPAYTDASLARAIRDGVDSGGAPLQGAMPRFGLDDGAMTALIAYLKRLSATPSPGVDGERLHVATVFASGAPSKSMIEIVEAFFRDHNDDPRNTQGRRRGGSFIDRAENDAYRKWELHRWEMSGEPASWNAQLEEHLRRQPVFALLSGHAIEDWSPIHDFCERNEIPCLLPNSDTAVVSDTNRFTVYFSAGLELEAKTIAAHATRQRFDKPVRQIFRRGSKGEAGSSALRRAVETHGAITVEDSPIETATAAGFGALVSQVDRGSAVVLWLEGRDVDVALQALSQKGDSSRVYLSATLAGDAASRIPAELAHRAHVVRPFALEDDLRSRSQGLDLWLQSKGIAVQDRRLQAQTFFACRLLGEALMRVRNDYYYREYLLELVDHMAPRMGIFCASHPSVSFGPGQRYLSKGCFVVSPSTDARRPPSSEWIVP